MGTSRPTQQVIPPPPHQKHGLGPVRDAGTTMQLRAPTLILPLSRQASDNGTSRSETMNTTALLHNARLQGLRQSPHLQGIIRTVCGLAAPHQRLT